MSAGSRRRSAILSGHARPRVPPWPIVLSLVVLMGTRWVGTRLTYSLRVPWEESAMESIMAATLFSWWSWPAQKRDARGAVRTAGRLAMQLGLVYLAWLPACVRAHHGDLDSAWFLLHRPLYALLLLQPLARGLAELRLDPQRSPFEAWGPAALFAFWGLMIPAVLQGFAVNASPLLFWLRLIAPVAATCLMSIHLIRSSSVGPWWRELGSLVVRHWRLPVLFLFGEVGTVLVGTLGALD